MIKLIIFLISCIDNKEIMIKEFKNNLKLILNNENYIEYYLKLFEKMNEIKIIKLRLKTFY
jgi:hypothetical protein